jgi:hypothetical protein
MPEQENTNIRPEFTKEVAKYFMNFLETDFHRNRIVKRNTNQKTNKGFKVGLDLDKYPRFKDEMFQILNKGLEIDTLDVGSNKYTAQITNNQLRYINLQIDNLNEKNIQKVYQEIKKLIQPISKDVKDTQATDKDSLDITKFKPVFKKIEENFQFFCEKKTDEIRDILNRVLITPFMVELDESLNELVGVNGQYQLELDLLDCIFSLFDDKLKDVLLGYYSYRKESDKEYKFSNLTNEFVSIEEIKDKLTIRFF